MYESLRSIARGHLRKQNGPATVNTTALVHEAFLRLVDDKRTNLKNRNHFLAVYSLVMRNLLVDLARRRSARKRGGDRQRVTLDDSVIRIDDQADEILELNEALETLSQMNPRLARTVECRFFAGFSEVETAGILEVSERTVRRDWLKAKAILYRILHPEASGS